MAEEHIWNLIAKKLSGEASQAELQELEKLLRDNPDLHYPVQTIIDMWLADSHFNQQEAHEAFNRHLQRLKDLNIDFDQKDQQESDVILMPSRRKRFLRPAIAVALVTGALYAGIRLTGSQEPVPAKTALEPEKTISQVSTRNGSKTNLILPDGTKVWLNAGSSLTYDSSYGKNLREVSLSGEGFFEVVKNKEKPFIIHASKINVKVLGTEFNVRSYPTDKTTVASLIRGSIEVTFKDKPNKKIILKPNEKIIVDNNLILDDILENSHQRREKNYEVPGVDIKKLTHEFKTGTIIETSWVENKLIFQDESFEEIANMLERWYGVTIIFKNNQLKENHLTGSFRTETIEQALDALKFTASFKYEIDKNNTITIF